MAIQIGEGNFKSDTPHYKVKEFQSMVEQMLLTADQLHSTEQQLVNAKEQAEQANYIELEYNVFSIEELMQGLADLFIRSIENKQLELFIKIDHTVPPVVGGDVKRIRQVLIKLIGNAIKFTEQGEIKLTVEVVARQNQQALWFLVSDTGMGISEEAVDSMFQAFTQADVSISRKFSGTGLGLAICQQLVSLMGGVISVSSQLGEGSTFEFTLGLRAESRVESLLNVEQKSGLRVLVIDDNQTSCAVLQYYLQEWKCKVNRALSVAQAIIAIRQACEYSRPFDLLFLEGELWESEATQIVQILESPELQPRPEIILLIDSHYQESWQSMTLNVKPKALLNKPVLRSRLLTAIQVSQQEVVSDSGLISPIVEPEAVPIAEQARFSIQLPGFEMREILSLLDSEHAQLGYVFTMFKEDFAPIVDELSASLSKGEFYDAKMQLHKIKGVAGNIGAIRLYDVSEELDQLLKGEMFKEDFVSELSAIQNQQSNPGRFEHEIWARWQVTFAETLKTIVKFLDEQCVEHQQSDIDLPGNVIPFLQELDVLLLENAYISSELLGKIDSTLGINQSRQRQHQALLNCLMNYDYPEARRVLADLLNVVRGVAV